MAIEVKLPELGEDIESGDIADILVSEGDDISVEQDILEIETDKAVAPVPSTHAGRVSKIHVSKGDTVSPGDVLITLEGAEDEQDGKPAKREGAEEAAKDEDGKQAKAEREPDEEEKPAADEDDELESAEEERPVTAESTEAEEAEKEKSEETEHEPPAADEAGSDKPAPSAGEGTSPVAASPGTRRLARELGVDVRDVPPSGSGDRVTPQDVKDAVHERLTTGRPAAERGEPADDEESKREPPPGEPSSDDWGPVRRERLSKIRETIAKNLSHSAATIPHVTNFDDADITELERLRADSFDEEADVKLTLTPFVIKAVALALRRHPYLNASIDLGEKEIIFKQYVNVGVAVDTERGLVVPVLRGANGLAIPEIAASVAELAEGVREGRFESEDARGATFTVSNLGAIGGAHSTPIINPPEVAVLLLGRSRELAPDADGRTRQSLPLSLSYDHRLVDGATAARFLNEVIGFLERPGRLLLAV